MKIRVTYSFKKMLLTILIFSSGAIVTSCDYGHDTEIVYTTSCFTVVDNLNNDPLDSVYIDLKLRYPSGVYYDLSGKTNTSGKCCFEYESGSSIISLFARRAGYVCFSHLTSTTIRMDPIGYLQIHIKNIPPADQGDWIAIYWPDDGCGGESLGYGGANIDTTVTLDARPGTDQVYWEFWLNTVRIDSTFEVVLRSYNTTFVEIFY